MIESRYKRVYESPVLEHARRNCDMLLMAYERKAEDETESKIVCMVLWSIYLCTTFWCPLQFVCSVEVGASGHS